MRVNPDIVKYLIFTFNVFVCLAKYNAIVFGFFRGGLLCSFD